MLEPVPSPPAADPMEHLPEERDLWRRAAAGDEDGRAALGELALKIAVAELRRRAVRAGELEDLAQESVRSTLAFLARGGAEPRDLRTFLKYRARGILSDHRKKMRTTDDTLAWVPGLEPAEAGAGPDGRLDEGALRAALAKCRAGLSPEKRAVLELRYDDGREAAEIARLLGIHRNTVGVRVFRALAELRECLRRRGWDGGVEA